jgi:hypothetical protein
MLDGVPKQLRTFPRRTTKPEIVVQPMMEVTPDRKKAECLIEMTESGRGIVIRHVQSQKRRSGILVNCDGVSNVTDDNFKHPSKTE